VPLVASQSEIPPPVEPKARRPRVWRAKTDALRLEFATYTKIDKKLLLAFGKAEAWVRRRRLFRQ